MSAETARFAEQVSAVSPLEGDALDGSAQPKPRRQRAERRERMDASLTFFCSNPQCDHTTWAPVEQARHMAQEFDWAAKALARLAPDSLEAQKLTGGVLLAELTDAELRQGNADWQVCKRLGLPVPLDVRLRISEYRRRIKAGEYERTQDRSEYAPRRRHIPLAEKCRQGHEYTPENTYVAKDGSRTCRTCARAWDHHRRQKNPEIRERGREYAAEQRAKRGPWRQRSPENRERANDLAREARKDPEKAAREKEAQQRYRQRHLDEVRARDREKARQRRLRKKQEAAG